MAHSNCIFCKILTREAPATILFENDEIIVFADIKPAAKHHFLVVPKNHIPSINSLVSQEDKLLSEYILKYSCIKTLLTAQTDKKSFKTNKLDLCFS